MVTEHIESTAIDARPTKRLVAYVLTKDISLQDALLDLIDNSIDGARRAGRKKFAGYEARLTLDRDRFQIQDNCGGIPHDVARDYAFRFGRPEDYAPIDGPSDAIGNFGVGMKRALLKIGKKILIECVTTTVRFKIVIDVQAWLKDDVNWNFEFSEVIWGATSPELTGTSISITELYSGVSAQFALSEFGLDLRSRVQEKEAPALNLGFSIWINGKSVVGITPTLGQSRLIKPLRLVESLTHDDSEVRIELTAGLESPDNDAAGWYVTCNGRTVLYADRSEITGWGVKEDSVRIPSFHNQYSRFRGYLFFHSDNPDALPWNTTKTGLDAEHPLYRRYRLKMIEKMKEIFGFLNEVDREKDVADQPLTEAVEAMASVPLSKVRPSTTFVRPTLNTQQSPKEKRRWIRYQRSSQEVTNAMEALGVGTPEEVGHRTFEMYYTLNVEP